jgi:cytochrome c
MKFTAKVVLVLLVVLSLSLFAMAQAGDAKKGKDLYTSKCLTCHGEKGEGKPAIAKMFGVTMLPLASKEVQSKSDADLVKVILEGKGKMKPVTVTKTEATDIVAYLKTLK